MNEQLLWKEYKNLPSPELKKRLMMNYSNLVYYVIHRSRLYEHGVLNTKDFFQFGIEGLSEAIDRYDPKFGTKFETYAIKRIKGKIIDEIRKNSEKTKIFDKENSQKYYEAISLNSNQGEDTQLYEIIPAQEETPQTLTEKNEQKEILLQELKKLKERDRLILTLYYFEGLNYQEIGEVLNITVSRVSQIHSRLMKTLKKKLEKING